MLTSHGHHIPGTEVDEDYDPEREVGCLSLTPFNNCPSCIEEARLTMNDQEDPITKAKRVVAEKILRLGVADSTFEVYVVTFTFILGGWKTMVSSTLPDGRYYEVTYNVAKKETYLDSYIKESNEVIQDKVRPFG